MRAAKKEIERSRIINTVNDTENAIQTNTEANTEEITASVDFSYYKNRIDESIKEYEIINDVNIREIKKTEWNAVLIYIYNHVFKLSKKQNNMKYRYSPYNDSVLMNALCDYYIYLCYTYNKPINIMGFNHMLNLSDNYLYRYSNKDSYIYIDIDNNNKVIQYNQLNKYRNVYNTHTIVKISNDTMSTIRQKLVYNSERSLQDMALDGSVMALAVGKIVHGWEEGKKAQVQADILEKKYALPSDLIDKYSDN